MYDSRAARVSESVFLPPAQPFDTLLPILVESDEGVPVNALVVKVVQLAHDSESPARALTLQLLKADFANLLVEAADALVRVAVRTRKSVLNPAVAKALLNQRKNFTSERALDGLLLTAPCDIKIHRSR